MLRLLSDLSLFPAGLPTYHLTVSMLRLLSDLMLRLSLFPTGLPPFLPAAYWQTDSTHLPLSDLMPRRHQIRLFPAVLRHPLRLFPAVLRRFPHDPLPAAVRFPRSQMQTEASGSAGCSIRPLSFSFSHSVLISCPDPLFHSLLHDSILFLLDRQRARPHIQIYAALIHLIHIKEQYPQLMNLL